MKRLLFLAAALLPLLPSTAEESPAPTVLQEKFPEWRFEMFIHFKDTDIHRYEYPFLKAMKRPTTLPPEGNVHAAEVCDTLGLSWFWTPRENERAMKSVEEVTAMLELCKNRRADYLLHVGPDDTGRLPDYTVKRLGEIGARLAVAPAVPDKP